MKRVILLLALVLAASAHGAEPDAVARKEIAHLIDHLASSGCQFNRNDRDKYVGGYSMRVMFRRGREQWGDLPPALKAEQAKYI